MSQFLGKLDIFSQRFTHYFDAFVATGVYSLFKKLFKKIIHVQNEGGRQRPFEQCLKKLNYWLGWASLTVITFPRMEQCADSNVSGTSLWFNHDACPVRRALHARFSHRSFKIGRVILFT